MSYIGIHMSNFFNTVFNPNIKLSEIEIVLNELYPVIMNGTFIIPDITNEIQGLLDNVDVIIEPFNNRLSTTVYENGKTFRRGYNPLLIKTRLSDISLERLLVEISDEQNQLYIQLTKIYNEFQKKILLFKALAHITESDISNKFNIDLFQYPENMTAFPFVNNRQPVSPMAYRHNQISKSSTWLIEHNLELSTSTPLSIRCFNTKNEEISSNGVILNHTENSFTIIFPEDIDGYCAIQRVIRVYPFICAFIALARAYDKSSVYQLPLLEEIHTTDILTDNDIIQEFGTYISDNSEFLSSELTEFFFKSIFLFSGNMSTKLTNDVNTVIQNELPTISQLFQESYDVDEIALQISTYLAYDVATQIAHTSALSRCHDNFYDRMEEFFDFENGKEWFGMQEDAIAKFITGHFAVNIEKLKMLEYIAYHFRDNSLFFINTYYTIHSRFSQELIIDIEPGFDLTDWSKQISFKEDSIENFKTYLNENYLEGDDDLIRFHLFLRFRTVLLTFVNTDRFKEWVMKTLLPKVVKTVNINYLNDIDEYKVVDIICHFFMTRFMLDMINDNILPVFLATFTERFNYYLTNSSFGLNDTELEYHIKKGLDDDTMKNLLNCFFKASLTSKYVESGLSPYSL